MVDIINYKDNLLSIFKSGLTRVIPRNLLTEKLKFENGFLKIENKEFRINNNVYVVGFGKAVYSMGKFVNEMLSEHIVSGILSVPLGTTRSVEESVKIGNIKVYEGANHNLPDDKAEFAARKIMELVSRLEKTNVLIVLISGGGSALLPNPLPPITLEEKRSFIMSLSNCGANIHEMNTVRKRLSLLKGGKMSVLSYPATVISLILSDVIDNPLHTIACGPTVPNNDTKTTVAQIVEKYNLNIPNSISKVLNSDFELQNEEYFRFTHNFIVGNNVMACETARDTAIGMGYESTVVTTMLTGEARVVGRNLSSLIEIIVEYFGERQILDETRENLKKFTFLDDSKREDVIGLLMSSKYGGQPACLVFGGETVVKVSGSGLGGRNQELALSCAISAHRKKIDSSKWLMLSCGTDGFDGPTNAAGAFAHGMKIRDDEELTKAVEYLDNNDSHSFYESMNSDLVVTGHTGTNVMDIVLIFIKQ